MNLEHKGMFNTKPAGKWDEAYPSGNGVQGVLVMGEPLDETIIFNHERLFLPLPENTAAVLPDMSGELPVIRRLIREGRYRDATRHFLNKVTEKGFPSELLWTDPFHPAYELRIKTSDVVNEGCGGKPGQKVDAVDAVDAADKAEAAQSPHTAEAAQSPHPAEAARSPHAAEAAHAADTTDTVHVTDDADYLRWLDFETGEAGIRWRGKSGVYKRRVFVSRACDAVVVKLDAPTEGKLDCDIYLAERAGRQHIKSVSVKAGTMADLAGQIPEMNSSGQKLTQDLTGQMPAQTDSADDIWFIFESRYEVGNGGYYGIARVHAEGGNVELVDGIARLRNACGAIIAARTIPDGDNASSGLAAAMAELAALPADYDTLLREHARIHGELFNRLRLELGGEEAETAVHSNAKPEVHSNAEIEAHSNAEPGARSNAEPGARSNAELEAHSNAELEAHSNAELEAHSNAELEAHSNTELEARSNAELEAHSNAELEARSNAELEVHSNAEPGAHSNVLPVAYSNEELMEQAREGSISPAFVEKMHDYGRYLLISSSGDLPPNLQGVWNGIWTPPWSSDYTLNENLQMMMWQVLPGNMPELAQSYFNLIESFVDDWKMNARLLYGCRGILSSPRSTTSGLTKHFCEDFPMMFWTAGAGWLTQMFYDYWQFTGDDAFLKDHTVPVLKEIALFYEDFLVEGPDGKYEFIPSYSPENTPSNSDNPVSINATMDIAVAKEVLTNLISACEWLGIDKDDIPKWRDMLGKLPDYLVNSDGALKEWSHPAFEDDYHHRHSSHLYPVFPGFEVTSDGTPELYQACLRAAELRLTDGIEAITGWGLAHLANISARLKDGELGFRALNRIMAKFLLPNLFTCHNEGFLFQMDANLGFSAAVLEMLVFSQTGYIELLPALPRSLSKGTANGILCRGQITLAELHWDMCRKAVSVVIRSEKDQQIRLKLPGIIKIFEGDGSRVESGSDGDAAGCGNSSQIGITLKKGVETRLSFILK
jgi:alpha-L-fucosidase 2